MSPEERKENRKKLMADAVPRKIRNRGKCVHRGERVGNLNGGCKSVNVVFACTCEAVTPEWCTVGACSKIPKYITFDKGGKVEVSSAPPQCSKCDHWEDSGQPDETVKRTRPEPMTKPREEIPLGVSAFRIGRDTVIHAGRARGLVTTIYCIGFLE